ncbi:MAG: DUF3303 family protein [Bacteroidota bacterium]
MKSYLVIEIYKAGKTEEIYERFSKKGRMLPQGVEYVNSWIEEDLKKCYQIMKSESEEKLIEWIEKWKDLVDFEIIPVIDSQEAAQRAKGDEVK